MKDDVTLSQVAAAQYGLVTRADTEKVGLSPQQLGRRTISGDLVIVHENVYRVAGAPVTRRQQLLAACMACDNAGYAARRSAAELLDRGRDRRSSPRDRRGRHPAPASRQGRCPPD